MVMAIHLTEQQRQALESRQGRAVEVIDPVTRQVYVLVTAEAYERMRSLLESGREEGSASGVLPPAAAGAGEIGPLRQRVRTLPLPPDLAAEVKAYCKRLGLWRAGSRREMEEQMKIQYYYGGQWIAYLRTDEGPVVVAAAASLNDASFDQQLSFLSAEERRSAVIDSPTRLFDKGSEILTPFSDES